MLKANVAAWRRRGRARHLKPAEVRVAAEQSQRVETLWQAQVRARSAARTAKRTEVRARRLRDWAHCDQRRIQSWARR